MTAADELYEDMHKHAEFAPVLQLLDMADGSDDFSRGLALVRDCFSKNRTLRTLSRNRLRGVMQTRLRLQNAYETAVMMVAEREHGVRFPHFMAALDAISEKELQRLKASYLRQLERLRR